MTRCYCTKSSIQNKNAFQQDAYRPLLDRMLESASRGGGSAWSRGGCLVPGRVSAWSWGVCLVLGVCLVPGGVCLVPGGCLPGPRGVFAWSREGLPGPRGGMASQHALRQTPCPPPPCGQTHTCKNITLATTSLRPVIKCIIDSY